MFEIDVLAVGEKGRSGDAIAARWGSLGVPGGETAVIIDGGDKAAGEKLCDLFINRYRRRTVDLVVVTHTDQDHVSGLTEVIGNLDVRRLVMARPWMHVSQLRGPQFTGIHAGFARELRNEYPVAVELEDMAQKKSIPIVEPSAGMVFGQHGGRLLTLGPTPQYYRELFTQFGRQPYVTDAGQIFSGGGSTAVLASRTKENWTHETLGDPPEVSAENNSSVIQLLTVGNEHILFTGDAGVPALERAISFAESVGLRLPHLLTRLQVPHHGSRRNLSPSLLNRLIGPPVPYLSIPTRTAVVSAAAEGAPKHPSKKVLNALKRRGVECFVTAGNDFSWSSPDVPMRPGYFGANPQPFHHEVDEEEDD